MMISVNDLKKPVLTEASSPITMTKQGIYKAKPPGQYTAVLSGKGWGYVVPEPLTIGENETREISLVAHVQPHRIRLMQAGRPLANRNLDLTKTDGPRRVVVMLLTDENGWIDVRVGPGRFALKLTPFAVEKTNGSAEVTLPLPEGVTEIELD